MLRVNTGIPEFRNSGKFSGGKFRKMPTVISGKLENARFSDLGALLKGNLPSRPFLTCKLCHCFKSHAYNLIIHTLYSSIASDYTCDADFVKSRKKGKCLNTIGMDDGVCNAIRTLRYRERPCF